MLDVEACPYSRFDSLEMCKPRDNPWPPQDVSKKN
jgi:hypothetical protein